MLATDKACVTSITLHDYPTSFAEQLCKGDFLGVLQNISQISDSAQCHQQLLSSYESTSEKFVFAVSCLNVFIQSNFTGPLPTMSTEEFDTDWVKANSELNYAVYPLTKSCKFLEVALCHFTNSSDDSFTNLLFKLRTLYLKEAVFEEVRPTNYDNISILISTLEDRIEASSLPPQTSAHLLVEFAYVYLFFEQITKSKIVIEKAQQLIGFQFKLTGSMGKRTKWQSKPTPQLRVEAILEQAVKSGGSIENEPENIDINDEDLLEQVSYSENHANIITNLTAPFLLHRAAVCLKDNALEDLLREEVLAYLSAIVEGKTYSYCIKTHAYFLRSHLEKVTYRKLCRSMAQLEEVVQGLDLKKCSARTASFFVSGLPTSWVQEKLLAELYLKTGSNKSALDIFERLKLYEDQISTLTLIGRYEAAEKLTRELLAEGETPKLYCILGDNTQDISYYEKAWELSGQTYSRAMRSLGFHYFNIREMDRALECFLHSLKHNHLQADLWFTAGCTAMALTPNPDLKQAIRCFRESVLINDEDSQTWSNLGACFDQIEESEKAFNCFREAIRYSYGNWKIWENYIFAAARVKNFSEVIRAYKEIINLGQKFSDRAILNSLVAAVRDNLTDCKGKPGNQYFDKVIDLFKFTSTKVTSSFDLWRCYGVMYLDVEGREDITKGIDYTIKAYHALALNIEKSFDIYMKCVHTAGVLHQYIMTETKTSDSYPRHLQSLKVILQIIITKGNKILPTFDEESEAKKACQEAIYDSKEKLGEVEEAQLYV